MTKVKFPYCRTNKTCTECECSRPFVQLTLSTPNGEFPSEGLVDSGCTETLADASIAAILGIDLTTCATTSVGGVSGSTDGYMANINFAIAGIDQAFSGPVIFVQDLPVSVLLGQDNFFEKFHIHFKKSEYLFTLEWVA